MNRRIIFTTFFIVFAAAVAWYASANVVIPEYTFDQAATVGDTKKKVIVTGSVAPKEVTPEGKTLTFYMLDAQGKESKVFYDGQEEIPAERIAEVKAKGEKISVAGHTCGDRFHTSGISFH